jgi:FtsH-binding integral membrane protein
MAKDTKTPANNPSSRLESIFAYMAAGLIGTSILAMIIALVIAATGTSTPAVGQQTLPAFLVFYPQFGLVAGAASIIGLLITNIRRRTRENRNSAK